MKDMRLVLLLFAVLFFLAPLPTKAEYPHFEMRANPWADNGYMRLIETAKYYPFARDFPFFEFRNDYARSAHYVPRADHIKEKLTRLVFLIQHETDLIKIDEYLGQYNALIEDQLGNITVLSFALDQAKQDKRFGDDAWLTWLYKGLIRSMTLHHDGESLKTAYRLISFDEEQTLLDYLKVESAGTKLVSANDAYLYHRHMVHRKGKSAKKTHALYIDMTYPLHMIKNMQITENPYAP